MGTIEEKQIIQLHETKQQPISGEICVMRIYKNNFVSDTGHYTVRMPLDDAKDLAVVRQLLKRSLFLLNYRNIDKVIVLEPLASLVEQVLADQSQKLRKWHYKYIEEKFEFRKV